MKIRGRLIALALVAALLTGCGGGGAETETGIDQPWPETVEVTLDGRIGPANVGLLLAEKRGYFDDFRLDVRVGSPVRPNRPAAYVTFGTDDLGLAQLPQVLLAKEKGMPLVVVGSLLPQPTAAMIWLKSSGIRGVGDLKGKTIAIPGVRFQEALLKTVLERAGLTLADMELKRVGYDLVPALTSGRADAIFGGAWNVEGAALEARGARPVIRRVQSLGVPAYDELVVIGRSDYVAENPQLIRDFMSTAARGIADAVSDPDAAARVIAESNESSPEFSSKETEAALRATLPLLSASGHLDPAQAADLVDWMHEQGLIRKQWPRSELFTNEYLEGP